MSREENDANATQPAGAIEASLDRALGSRLLMPLAILVVVAVAAFFAYAVREYLSADCYEQLRADRADRDIAHLLDSLDDTVTELRKGSSSGERWTAQEFQDEAKRARSALAAGRAAQAERKGFATLNAIDSVEQSLSKMKRLATTRVNDILKKQDPQDPDAFEKYRIEGKMLVAIVKRIDESLEQLSGRRRFRKGACDW